MANVADHKLLPQVGPDIIVIAQLMDCLQFYAEA